MILQHSFVEGHTLRHQVHPKNVCKQTIYTGSNQHRNKGVLLYIRSACAREGPWKEDGMGQAAQQDRYAEELKSIIIHQNLNQGQHRLICPWCSNQRKKRGERCLSASVEATRCMYSCKHCGEEGSITLQDNVYRFRPAPQKKSFNTPPPPTIHIEDLDSSDYDWLDSRGISTVTADIFNTKNTPSGSPIPVHLRGAARTL